MTNPMHELNIVGYTYVGPERWLVVERGPFGQDDLEDYIWLCIKDEPVDFPDVGKGYKNVQVPILHCTIVFVPAVVTVMDYIEPIEVELPEPFPTEDFETWFNRVTVVNKLS